MSDSKWDKRIRRAKSLETTYSFATDALRFYEGITTFQRSLYSEIETVLGNKRQKRASGSLCAELDLFLLLPKFRGFLSYAESISPDPVAETAIRLGEQGFAEWQELLKSTWENAASFQPGVRPTAQYLAWMFLQPYAEFLADHTELLVSGGISSLCPICAARPQVGVLRQEGDGAKRSLVCSLCSTEWTFRRILCPACGEEDVDKLAVYTADQFNHVRVEACDTCRSFIKTVDLTRNGIAVPVVDELGAVPLSLWAQERGYKKLRANLLGI